MEKQSKEALRIFVLADTHNRLPDSVTEMAKDADEIWHLGDVCAETILDELLCAEIATAISSGHWSSILCEVG